MWQEAVLVVIPKKQRSFLKNIIKQFIFIDFPQNFPIPEMFGQFFQCLKKYILRFKNRLSGGYLSSFHLPASNFDSGCRGPRYYGGGVGPPPAQKKKGAPNGLKHLMGAGSKDISNLNWLVGIGPGWCKLLLEWGTPAQTME